MIILLLDVQFSPLADLVILGWGGGRDMREIIGIYYCQLNIIL